MINNEIFYKDRGNGSHIYHSKLDSSDFCLAGHSVTGKLNKILPNYRKSGQKIAKYFYQS